MSKKILLGQCTKPHGIKGGFTFRLLNPKDSVLSKGSELNLYPLNETSSISEQGERFKIKSINHGPKVIVYLDTITDRNIVEAMIPFEIFVNRDSFPTLPEDEVYLSDLLGFNVLNEDGNVIGSVTSFSTNGIQDILVIEKSNGDELEVVFVETFVKDVCLEKKEVIIIEPEYI